MRRERKPQASVASPGEDVIVHSADNTRLYTLRRFIYSDKAANDSSMGSIKIIFFDYFGVLDSLSNMPAEQQVSLRTLATKYRLGVISNSGARMRSEIDALCGEGFFGPIVLSGECGLIKPSREIFEYARSQAQVKLSEAMFVDDQQLHLEGAQAAGFRACLLFGSSRQDGNKFESVPDFGALKDWLDE